VVLLAVIISQSVFASGMLWFSAQNKLSNRLLAILLFAIALWLTDDFMRIGGLYRQKPSLYFMPIFYSFSFGPLIWFYVRSLTNHNFHFTRKHLLHFIPVILQACLYWFLAFKSYQFKNWYWQSVHQPYTYRIEFDGTWISLMVYLVLSIRLLQKYQGWVVNNFSEVSLIRLNWLKIILAVLLVLCVQWTVEIILRDFGNSYFQYDFTVELLGIVALVLGVAGWRQSNLSEVSYNQEEQDEQARTKAPFEPDPLVLEQITRAMEQDRLYLNPTLTLVELAKALKLNPKTVSRNINAGFDKSFNDLVNEYRVAEVKRRLKSPDVDRMTILGIAYESGFNSKTTFNRIFKQVTGNAPTEFIG
jgi:AraC-like DNA-binding protein